MDPILVHAEVAILSSSKRQGDPLGLALHSADSRCRVDEYEELHILKEISDVSPVHIQFKASAPFKITAVGFSKCGKPRPHTKEGRCGGCFRLERNIDPDSDTTPPILDKGRFRRRRPDKYRFTLWVQGMQEPSVPAGIDPQIYNQGVGPPTWWQKLWMLFLKLWNRFFGG